jgi:hypothetical protein
MLLAGRRQLVSLTTLPYPVTIRVDVELVETGKRHLSSSTLGVRGSYRRLPKRNRLVRVLRWRCLNIVSLAVGAGLDMLYVVGRCATVRLAMTGVGRIRRFTRRECRGRGRSEGPSV